MTVDAVGELTACTFGARDAFEKIGGGEDHLDGRRLCLAWSRGK